MRVHVVPLRDYYGGNWDRLREINHRYDPHGVFDSRYSIPAESLSPGRVAEAPPAAVTLHDSEPRLARLPQADDGDL